MKILYIEDEYPVLSNVLPDIWGAFMTPEENKKWDAIKKDTYSGCQEIKELFADNPFLNVEFNFLDALNLIETTDVEQYDYFVFDRNLGTKEQGITFDDIKKVFPRLTQAEYDYIKNNDNYGREGDFLLKRLYVKMNNKLKNRIYFLSAYPSEDVFRDNEVLRDIVDEAKVLTKENYIEKGDKKGIKRLKDLMESDDEEMQLYKKWGKVLSYYDQFDKGYLFRKEIVSALTSNSIASSQTLSEQESDALYYKYIEAIDKFYKGHFSKAIDAQLTALRNAWNKESNHSQQTYKKKQDFENEWYKTAKIPRNIIEISNIIPQTRNNCVHQQNQKNDNDVCGVDVCGLTVLSCAYALLEITRFWQDKGLPAQGN